MKRIPAFLLRREPITDDAASLPGFRWAAPAIGTRNRIGGEPSFIDPADYPSCTICNEPMTFYGQLDSINDDYVLADAGVVVVFVCFDCFTSEAIIRSN